MGCNTGPQVRRCGDLELCRFGALACDLWLLLQSVRSLGLTAARVRRRRMSVWLVLLRVYLLPMHFYPWHQEPWQTHEERVGFDSHGKFISCTRPVRLT